MGWETGDEVSIMVGNTMHDVEITGVTKGEVSRTIYFHRADLSELTGVESTSILIQLPDDSSLNGLSNITVGYSLKSDSIKTFESLLEQQQQFIASVQFLGIIIAIAVLFNTLADDGQIIVDKTQKYQQEKGQWNDPESFLKV